MDNLLDNSLTSSSSLDSAYAKPQLDPSGEDGSVLGIPPQRGVVLTGECLPLNFSKNGTLLAGLLLGDGVRDAMAGGLVVEVEERAVGG